MSTKGQSTVELVLMLPIFLWIIFVIMELGQIAFKTIVVHHLAYEMARIASLTSSFASGGSPKVPNGEDDLKPLMIGRGANMLRDAFVETRPDKTQPDPQAGVLNYDVIVTVSYNAPLIFPFTNVLLGLKCPDEPSRESRRCITAEVRMPIEQPLFK